MDWLGVGRPPLIFREPQHERPRGMDSRSESGMTDRDYFWARDSASRMKSAVSWMRRWVSSIGSHQPV